MNKYTVVWSDEAIDALTKCWMDGIDRLDVTRASEKVDKALTFDPETIGANYGDDRILIVEPIWVAFTVEPEDRLVTVLRMGRPVAGQFDYE